MFKRKRGFFPYEFFDDIDNFRYDRLPPHEAFYSTLKNANITDEEYAFCQRVWDEKKKRQRLAISSSGTTISTSNLSYKR